MKRAFWSALFDAVDIDLQTVSVLQQPDSNVVSAYVTGVYTVKDSNDANNDAQTYPFAFGWLVTMAGNTFASINEVMNKHSIEAAKSAMGVTEEKEEFPAASSLLWTSAGAKARVADVMHYYGNPSYFNNVAGQSGFAVWLNANPTESTGCISVAYLRDEALVANATSDRDQKSHTEYLYTIIKVDIPNAKFHDIQKVSRSVSYDFLTRELTARGDHLGSNFVQLWLALKYANNEYTLATVQANLGKGVALTLRVNAAGQPIYESDGSLAYSDLFVDIGKQICKLQATLNNA